MHSMKLYHLGNAMKSFGLTCLQKFSPGLGLSRFIPSFEKFEIWMSRPPKIADNTIGEVRTKNHSFSLHLAARDRVISPVIYTRHQWEPHLTAVVEQVIKPGNLFIDIGANLGYYSVLAANCVGKSGRVLSFEPDVQNYELLNKNVQLNGQDKVVETFMMGVGNEEKSTKLYGYTQRDAAGRGFIKPDVPEYSQDVEMVCLDSFLKKMKIEPSNVSAIKIDIEGYEPLACEGMTELLKQPNLSLFLEYNPVYMDLIQRDAKKYLEQLEDYGFKFHLVHKKGTPVGHYSRITKQELLDSKEKSHDLYCTKK